MEVTNSRREMKKELYSTLTIPFKVLTKSKQEIMNNEENLKNGTSDISIFRVNRRIPNRRNNSNDLQICSVDLNSTLLLSNNPLNTVGNRKDKKKPEVRRGFSLENDNTGYYPLASYSCNYSPTSHSNNNIHPIEAITRLDPTTFNPMRKQKPKVIKGTTTQLNFFRPLNLNHYIYQL